MKITNINLRIIVFDGLLPRISLYTIGIKRFCLLFLTWVPFQCRLKSAENGIEREHRK